MTHIDTPANGFMLAAIFSCLYSIAVFGLIKLNRKDGDEGQDNNAEGTQP